MTSLPNWTNVQVSRRCAGACARTTVVAFGSIAKPAAAARTENGARAHREWWYWGDDVPSRPRGARFSAPRSTVGRFEKT